MAVYSQALYTCQSMGMKFYLECLHYGNFVNYMTKWKILKNAKKLIGIIALKSLKSINSLTPN